MRRRLEAGHVVLGILAVGRVLRLLPGIVACGRTLVEGRAGRVAGVASAGAAGKRAAVLAVLAWLGHWSGRVCEGGTGEPGEKGAVVDPNAAKIDPNAPKVDVNLPGGGKVPVQAVPALPGLPNKPPDFFQPGQKVSLIGLLKDPKVTQTGRTWLLRTANGDAASFVSRRSGHPSR